MLYWLCQSLWLCGSQQTGKFWKRWEYQTTWPASWEICMQVRKQQLELDMEQQTDSKSGKEYVKAVYCHPAYLTYMQSTSWEMLDCMKHKQRTNESEIAQSCLTLCNPMDCSLPGSSIHRILQARVLKWVAISFSRGSFQHRDWTCVSHIAGRRFTVWVTKETKD